MIPFQLSSLAYPDLIVAPSSFVEGVGGRLIGTPFILPAPVPAGTKIRIFADTEKPEGTNITVSLRNTDTGETLPVNGTEPGLGGEPTALHPGVELLSEPWHRDRLHPATARSYTWSIPAHAPRRTPPHSWAADMQSWRVQGPDGDGDSENAEVYIEDLRAELYTGPLYAIPHPQAPADRGGRAVLMRGCGASSRRVTTATRPTSPPCFDGNSVSAVRAREGRVTLQNHHNPNWGTRTTS